MRYLNEVHFKKFGGEIKETWKRMPKKITIKVCGMQFPGNRQEVEKLEVDLLGYIFYARSKRFVSETPDPGLFNSAKPKVGVFVNEDISKIIELADWHGLEWIQLHGDENPQTCRILKNEGLKIIKAFNVDGNFDFEKTKAFEKDADFFLFDTKTFHFGGSGEKFDWNLLDKYTGKVPFLLSGGIGPNDAETILQIDHPMFFGIDLNSGFEEEPGIKNIEKLAKFINEIKSLDTHD